MKKLDSFHGTYGSKVLKFDPEFLECALLICYSSRIAKWDQIEIFDTIWKCVDAKSDVILHTELGRI